MAHKSHLIGYAKEWDIVYLIGVNKLPESNMYHVSTFP